MNLCILICGYLVNDTIHRNHYLVTVRRVVMMSFSSTAAVPSQRHFSSKVLEIGAPNLLVTAPGVCKIMWAGGYVGVSGCVGIWSCVHLSLATYQSNSLKQNFAYKSKRSSSLSKVRIKLILTNCKSSPPSNTRQL